MPVMRRQFTYQQPAGAGGGGGPVVATVAWGPDFGDEAGNDGNSFPDVTATVDIASLALVANLPVTSTVDLAKVDLTANMNVTAAIDGTVLGAPFWQSVATAVGETSPLTIYAYV